MGSAPSTPTHYATPSDESSSDDDDNFLPCSSSSSQDCTMDSLLNRSRHSSEMQMVRYASEIIADIERELDFYEKVSLVYLLYDDAKIAYQCLLNLQQNQHTNVLVEWTQLSMQTDNWQKKLLEALTIIQNYQVICKLGYEESEVKEKILPFNENTSIINAIKRSLYDVCESLENEPTERLLSIVKHDFQNKRISFEDFDPKYLEFYISYWMSIEYISPTNLTNLYRALQVTQNHEIATNLKLLVPNCIANSSDDCRALTYYYNEHFAIQDRMQNDEKCYSVDPEHPGICLIINQEFFFMEPERELQHLLPPNSETTYLENRAGTKLDCDKLQYTFNEFGFDVKVVENVIHCDMEKEVQNIVCNASNYSSLIICILSHGEEGKVYGTNSIPVEIGKIQRIMCDSNPDLKDKPKILILQSCQGTEFRKVTSDGENTEHIQRDKHNGIVPEAYDMLVFCATIPGYVALRSPTEGTWFIQSLCDAILHEAHEEHFGDICTSVFNKIRRKRWETEKGIIIGMIPVLHPTLTKKFYLPPMRRAERH